MAQPLMQPEILELVFSYLDGKSLLESSYVCSTWKCVVEHITGVTNVWKQCCEEEIPEDVLIDITTNLYPRLWASAGDDNYKWHNIYLCWLQWRNIGLWPCNIKQIYSISMRNELITCMKISGSCIITGHLNGGVHLWDCSQGYLRFITNHLKEVTDLGLISVPGKKEMYRGVDLKHNFVISTSLDYIIRVTPIYSNAKDKESVVLTHHVGPTRSISVYRSMFVVTGEDDSLSVWRLISSKENDWEQSPVLVYTRQDIDDPVQVISVWKGKITGITVSNHFYCLNGLVGQNAHAEINGVQKFTEKNSWIVRKYIWRHWICAWLTGHHQLYIAVGDAHASKQYNTMPALLSYPTALLLYGELFLIGMESGAVYAYVIKTPEDLLMLDLEAYEWRQSVSSEPILMLDIAEDNAEPLIVLSTGQKLYYIALHLS